MSAEYWRCVINGAVVNRRGSVCAALNWLAPHATITTRARLLAAAVGQGRADHGIRSIRRTEEPR